MYRSIVLLIALTFVPSVVMAQQPCTTDANQVVNEIYRHMLERAPDSGSAHWVQELQSGRSTVRDIVREIASSPEHTERFWKQEAGEETPYFRAVGTIYRHILGRQPDAAGARDWAQRGARSGVGAVIAQIVNSPEYSNQFGDWGVPGSGGLRYCGTGNQGAVFTPAPAPQTANNRVAARFQAMDRNNDGVITRTEWQGNRQTFDTTDVNGDGVLAGAEVRDGAGRGRGRGRGLDRDEVEDEVARNQRFTALDANGNGRVESREWQGTVAAFNRLDVNNDNVLSRDEVMGNANADVAPTSGDLIVVEATRQWTDTGLIVRAGDTISIQADGTVRLSDARNDIADPSGSRTNRTALDAPIERAPAGGLIARVGNSAPMFVGNRQTFRAPASGRLYLGVNDDFLGDNSGQFRVTVDDLTR